MFSQKIAIASLSPVVLKQCYRMLREAYQNYCLVEQLPLELLNVTFRQSVVYEFSNPYLLVELKIKQ